MVITLAYQYRAFRPSGIGEEFVHKLIFDVARPPIWPASEMSTTISFWKHVDSVERWCIERFPRDQFIVSNNVFWFVDEMHVLLVKLRWG